MTQNTRLIALTLTLAAMTAGNVGINARDLDAVNSNDTNVRTESVQAVQERNISAIDTVSIKNYIAELLEEEHKENEMAASMWEQLSNLPNVDVGKGISFSPKNESFKTTIRFRMQNLAGISFGKGMSQTQTQAEVKRLRLRFDGYIYSPKILYSIQLGFTGSDAKKTPNSRENIILDAIVYYKPSSSWNFGFGQAKPKLNRAMLNSSGALQFVDRSIVNSEFGGDRDFGFYGEYHCGSKDRPALAALGSITLGEGRNWGTSSGGFNYSGRLELYPMGKFHDKGEYIEGDTYRENTPKLMLGAGYSYNDCAVLTRSFKGSILPDGQNRDIHSIYADMIFKYRGFAFNADYMARRTSSPAGFSSGYIYTGDGVNVQASYILGGKWEVALRNSTLRPCDAVRHAVGYAWWNQSTLGITRYIIGHSVKAQMDLSYNDMKNPASTGYDRFMVRFQIELGL